MPAKPVSLRRWSRRDFLAATTLAAAVPLPAAEEAPTDPIIDIHQHTNYSGRTNDQFLRHQRAMGVTLSILLPAGQPVNRPSTHDGKSNGLAAECGGNDTVQAMARAHPESLRFFANEVADLPGAPGEIERYLKLGAIGIGEQKFSVDCDSPHIHQLAALAAAYRVPILLHFQHEMYNLRFEQFYRVLEKFPSVNFIGHAQTWWANVDRDQVNTPRDLYPVRWVNRGGITDRFLGDYPNMYGDLSAGSGLNMLVRDEDHTRWFLEKHQDKLLFGSDCNDAIGRRPGCQGANTIATLRRLAPSKQVERKILHDNSKKLFRL